MKKQTKLLVSIAVVAVIILGLIVAFWPKPAEEEVIKIGMVLPLTGEGTPDQGQASQKGAILAMKEINSEGGINGKKLKLVVEDSQCQPQKGVTAIEKLINVDKVDFIIGDICDSVTAAIMPIAEDNRKILITPGSTSPAISDAGDYIFRFWFSEKDLGGIVAEQAYKMGYRNISILYINNAWGIAQKNGVANKFEDFGGDIVYAQAINPNVADYKTEILKSEEKNPEAYYIGLHPGGLVTSIKQMKELGVEKQIFSHGGLVGSTQVLGLGGDLLEGIIAPFVFNPSEDFRNKFVDEFGEEPGITADSSYDAVMVLAKIMIKTREENPDTTKNELYKIRDYDGASGTITINEKGDIYRPLRLMVVKNGKLVLYSE